MKCFEAPGAELDAGYVKEMLPGISKRSAQKRLKTLFENGEIARRKEGGTVKILAHFPTTPRPAIRYGYSSSSVTSR